MPNPQPSAQLQDALRSFREGRYDESECMFEQLRQNDDMRAQALAGLGLIRLVRKDDAGAEQAFSAALEIEQNKDALYGLGQLAKVRDQFSRALKYFSQAAALGHVAAKNEANALVARLEVIERQLSDRGQNGAASTAGTSSAHAPLVDHDHARGKPVADGAHQSLVQAAFQTDRSNHGAVPVPPSPNPDDEQLAQMPNALPEGRAVMWQLLREDLLARTPTSGQSRTCLRALRSVERIGLRPSFSYAVLSSFGWICFVVMLSFVLSVVGFAKFSGAVLIVLAPLFYFLRLISLRRRVYTVQGGVLIARMGLIPREDNYELLHLLKVEVSRRNVFLLLTYDCLKAFRRKRRKSRQIRGGG